MTQKTLLNDTHRALGAKMVDFGGWDMPIHYGSQLDEHHLVRREAGVFDVSHMTVVDLRGDQLRKMSQSGMLPLLYAHLFSLSLMREIFGRQAQQGKMPQPQLVA